MDVMMPDTAIRLHAFDNLRASMMWLGIVLHSAMVYMEPANPLSGSPQTSLVATSLFGWIHIFRMPVFFIMAGFFAMLLVDRRGLDGTLRNRALRLAVPFALFWPLLVILINLIIMAHAKKSGLDPRGITLDSNRWIISTGHLWFLYYLMMITAALLPLLSLAPGIIPTRHKAFAQNLLMIISKRWWGLILLAWPGVILSQSYPLGIMSGDSSFAPSTTSLAYYTMFYVFGVLLYRAREELLPHFQQWTSQFFASGLVCFVIANIFGFAQMGLLFPQLDPAISSLFFRWFYCLATWLWCFFFMGFFLRFYDNQNSGLRYMAQSSYWVYLSHYPVVLFLAFALYDLNQHALVKMGLLIIGTTAITLLAYQLLIRRTVIARILGGTGSS